MGTWFEITSARWAIAGFVGMLVLAIVIGLSLGGWPTIDEIFADVADDRCPRFANGEPDREDSDCYGVFGGIDEVEAWDRAHPSP